MNKQTLRISAFSIIICLILIIISLGILTSKTADAKQRIGFSYSLRKAKYGTDSEKEITYLYKGDYISAYIEREWEVEYPGLEAEDYDKEDYRLDFDKAFFEEKVEAEGNYKRLYDTEHDYNSKYRELQIYYNPINYIKLNAGSAYNLNNEQSLTEYNGAVLYCYKILSFGYKYNTDSEKDESHNLIVKLKHTIKKKYTFKINASYEDNFRDKVTQKCNLDISRKLLDDKFQIKLTGKYQDKETPRYDVMKLNYKASIEYMITPDIGIEYYRNVERINKEKDWQAKLAIFYNL
jgi:hypothetical protein